MSDECFCHNLVNSCLSRFLLFSLHSAPLQLLRKFSLSIFRIITSKSLLRIIRTLILEILFSLYRQINLPLLLIDKMALHQSSIYWTRLYQQLCHLWKSWSCLSLAIQLKTVKKTFVTIVSIYYICFKFTKTVLDVKKCEILQKYKIV